MKQDLVLRFVSIIIFQRYIYIERDIYIVSQSVRINAYYSAS